VRVAKWRNIQIAAKKLHSSLVEADDSNLTNVANFKQEIEMLVKLRHPNLVLFIGICGALEDKPVILTELLSCSLYDLLENRKAVFDLPDILDISIDIANGLNYLHSHHPTIVHRDISSKNILLGGNKVKIADLGQAKIFDTGISRQTGMPGAMAYSAPEVLTGKYSEKIDIFSFGILLCQMCIGEYPRIGGKINYCSNFQGSILNFFPSYHLDRREEQNNQAVAKYGCLKSLLNSTVAYQPNLRPTAAFLCENLDLIRSNDRYYPSTRKVYPEKDIGIIARHWMKFQIDTATRDTKIALDQTSRRY
jgi:serine/threonine protein kinase